MNLTSYGSFDSLWRMASVNTKWWYLSDAIFHACFPSHKSGERRFKLGIFSWLLWAGIELLKGTRRRNSPPFICPAYLCGIPLPTPAHESTLYAFLEAFGEGKVPITLLGEPSGFPTLASLKPRWQSWGTSHPSSPIDAFLLLPRMFGLLVRVQADLFYVFKGQSVPFVLNAHACQLVFSYFCSILEFSRHMQNPPKCIVLTYELDVRVKGFVQCCREQATRVIHIMHGQRLQTYQVTMATDLVLFSKIDEPWFRARVDPTVRIWTVGHPRLEAVRKEVGPPLPQKHRLPNIAFFSQPAEGDYTRALRLADWEILRALRGRANVRFRAHPREDPESLKADIAAAGIDFVETSNSGLIEDLRWSDAVASSWSTVSMEAAVCGRGVFWTCSTPERYEASQELRENGIGQLVSDSNGWDDHLTQWQKGSWRAPIIVPEHRLRELGMIGETNKTWAERLEIET